MTSLFISLQLLSGGHIILIVVVVLGLWTLNVQLQTLETLEGITGI